MVSGDREATAVVKAIIDHKLIEADGVNTDSRKSTGGVLETLADEGDEVFLCHSVTGLEARADKKTQLSTASDEGMIAAEALEGRLGIAFVGLKEIKGE